jgi:hypothetical protein
MARSISIPTDSILTSPSDSTAQAAIREAHGLRSFYRGDEWFLPARTSTQLSNLRTVASANAEGRIVKGICVTGWTVEEENADDCHDIPCSGFPGQDRLGPSDGLCTALKTCRVCEANVRTGLRLQMAGCFGYLAVSPNSEELDDPLRTRFALGDTLSTTQANFTPHASWASQLPEGSDSFALQCVRAR